MGVSYSKLKSIKQGYRDEINEQRKRYNALAAKYAAKPKTVTVQAPVDTSKYTSQIDALTKQLRASQTSASTAASNYQSALNRASADYGAKLGSMQNLYASNLQSTKDQFGLQISGLQKDMATQAADFKTQQQTMATNQERARLAGATPELQLQESNTQKSGGTKAFKKRIGSQFNPSAANALASIKSGTLNI
jgi:dynactin complex subunit